MPGGAVRRFRRRWVAHLFTIAGCSREWAREVPAALHGAAALVRGLRKNSGPHAESHHSSHRSHSPIRHPSDRSPRQGPRQGQGPRSGLRSGLGRGPRQAPRQGQGLRLGLGRGLRQGPRQGLRSGSRSGLGRGLRRGPRQGALPRACLAKVAVGLVCVAPYVAWFGPGPMRGDVWQMLGKHGGFVADFLADVASDFRI